MSEKNIKVRLDEDQKKAVELRKNGAVSAGAGSGKTTVLAARYLDLVTSEGADVRSILVLTFTRKAAAEMYGRIYRELLASEEPRVREEVDRFSEAQISTLDSFCSLILRPEAQDYGYPPDFTVDDAECGRIAESQALSFLLERREDPVLREVFACLGFETAWKGLFAEVAARLWTPSDVPDIPEMAKLQRKTLADRARKDEEALRDAARRAAEEAASGQKLGAKAAQAAAALGALLAVRPGARPDGKLVTDIAHLNLQGYGKSDSDARVKEAASAAREAARKLLDDSCMEERAPLSEAVLARIAELGKRVREAKRLARVMGFRDVATCAVDLLLRRADVRSYWKRRFRFIMIDEFQDDDQLQKDLLYLLAEREDRSCASIPRASDLESDKLFFVGDEKQSIYRFRGADVSVFRGLSDELGGDCPVLGTNYRSEPALVDFFNEVFRRVMADAKEGYEARFSEISARPATPGVEPSLLYFLKSRRPPAEREGFRGDDEALAYALARFVKDAVENRRLRVPVQGKPKEGQSSWRYALYDDFAVLLRTTGKQYILEKFFRLLGVPYAAGDVCGLFAESPANDIYQALRLAVYPEDGRAYAAFLRSPFVRVSDDAFVRVLALGLPAFDPSAEAAAGLSEDDAARFQRGREIQERLIDRTDRDSLSSLVHRLWYDEGLRLAILRKPDAHPFLEHFDYIFRVAADADGRALSLASFVAELEPLAGTPERLADLDAPREAASGLRILTVHKAKGLEFPIVILPFMESTGKSGGNGNPWYWSKEGVTLNLKPWDAPDARRVNVFYDMARESEAAQERAELKRLFYVACTRASAHLIFAATEPRSADNRDACFHTLLAGGAGLRDDTGLFQSLPASVREVPVPDLTEGDYIKLYGGTGVRDSAAILPAYESARVVERRWPRREISASALNAAWVRLRRTSAPGISEPAEEILPALEHEKVQGTEKVSETLFGEICHAAIEAELDRTGRGRDDFKRALERVPDDLRAFVPLLEKEARALASGFLESPLGREALGARELRLEAPFLYSLEKGLLVSGRTDLLFRRGNEVVVVDFKSNAKWRDGEYDGQLAAYGAACRALYPGCAVKSCLFWLRAERSEERTASSDEDGLLLRAARHAAREETAPDSLE